MWIGANTNLKGLKEILKELTSNSTKEQQKPTQDQINKDWKRLASFSRIGNS